MGCFEGEVGVEVLNDVVMERTDLKRSSDWVAGSEAEPCAKKHAVEAPNDAECNPQTESPLKEALPSVELEKNCHASEGLEPCAENDTECNMQTESPLKEALPSVELEKSCHALEKLEPCGENDTECNMQTESPLKEALPSVELEKNCHALEELEPCVESDKQVVEKGVELEHSSENSTEDIVSGTDSKFSPKQPENEAPADSVQLSDPLQAKDDGGNLSVTAEKSTKEVLDDNELENRMKEASNEDIFSEVSDPKLSPGNTTSSHCAGATLSKEPGSCNIPGGCAEVSSLYSGNSSSESESLSEQEHIGNKASRDVSKSCVVLEIPKHVSTTGIRKITFRFSKPKEYCENVSSVLSAQPVYGEYSDDAYRIEAWNASVADHGRLFHERRVPPSSYSLKQLTQKVNPDIYPANVKKLLATGILEGARVKYISVNRETELSGIIWSDGYLCSCSSCNFSRVLSAYEFELHAGVKTRHPNNHIYLENGKPVYSIVQELKTAPLSMIDDVIHQIAGSSINMEKFQIWKANLQERDSGDHGDLSSSGQTPGFYYPDISYPSPMRKDIRMPPSYCSVNSQFYQDNVQLTGEQRKRVVKRPGWLSSNSDPDFEMEKVCEGGNGSGTKKSRDNDLHRQLFLPNGLPDGTDLAYYSKGKKILGGFKQDNGILCSCCHTVISPSQFESHAGWAVKRQPYRNIYTSTGLTLHDIALMLANGRNIASSNSDDMCAACGDGGDLLLCRGCPRAFHTACLGSHCGPSSDWLCPYCVDKSIPVRRGPGRPPLRQTRAVKAPLFVGGGCVVCRAPDFSVAKFDDRTVLLCDQCEKEYHVGCLRESGLCDLKELPRDKWFCCNDCHMIHTELQKFALGGAQIAPPEVYAAISKKHIEKGLMDVPASDFKWRILSGKSRYSEHLPLLSRASAIFRECFDPIVAKSGRDLIPIMVYGRNISGQEFGGMYCVVLIVKSVVVSAGLLRIFGREVAELPLVATCRDSQGKGYFLALFSCIERLLASMNVKNLVLPAAEEAESIWTKRLGFRRMSNARESRYNKEIQFTVFKGTTMLEKEVQSEDITDI